MTQREGTATTTWQLVIQPETDPPSLLQVSLEHIAAEVAAGVTEGTVTESITYDDEQTSMDQLRADGVEPAADDPRPRSTAPLPQSAVQMLEDDHRRGMLQVHEHIVASVLDAITDNGRSPSWHRQELQVLAVRWPSLARGLAWLLREQRRPVPAPWRWLL